MTSFIETRHWLFKAFAFILTLGLAACGGGQSTNNSQTPPSKGPSPTALDGRAYRAGYLTTIQVPLQNLESSIQSDAQLQVNQINGPATSYKLSGGNQLYILSPVEQFMDSTSIYRITGAPNGKVYDLAIPWYSRLGLSWMKISEADENGVAPEDDGADLVATGLKDGKLAPQDVGNLSFQLTNALPIDPKYTTIAEFTTKGSKNITDYFTISSNNLISLKPEYVNTLLSEIQKANVISISFSLSTSEYKKIYGFEQSIIYAGGRLNLNVIDANTVPASNLAGTQLVVRGFDTGYTYLTTLDASGKATVSSLPRDTYSITQVILGPGLPLHGYGVMYDPSAPLNVTIQTAPPASAAAAPRISTQGFGNETQQPAASFASSWSTNGVRSSAALPDRQRLDQSLKATRQQRMRAKAAASGTDQDYTVTVTAGEMDFMVNRAVSYTVPQGTKRVGIHVEQSTEEFPYYTQHHSQFNDLWYFDIQLPGNIPAFKQDGKVNQTNLTTGTLSFDRCVDMSAATATGPAQITGMIGAQNVADAWLPTQVTVTISNSCGTLDVISFQSSGSTPDGLFADYPRRVAINETDPDGNLAGQYLSIPLIARLPATSFGMPATITYSPADAEITAIELILRTSSGDVSIGTDYLTQANASMPGTLSFANLTLNPTQVARTSEETQLIVAITGKVNGSSTTSVGEALNMNNFTAFRPIYLSSETATYNANNRFGQHDEAGGDSWGTDAMLTWLQGTGMPYNDISGARVKQLAGPLYRSVLGHAGHSDGQQVDIRYWDGAGGFTAPLNGNNSGAGIQALAASALVEFNSHTNPHPNLDSLQAWVTQNRANLATYAALTTTRRIYVGRDFISTLLIDGQFPGTQTAIPNIGAWTNRSPKIRPQDHHLDHWHISTNLH